MVQMLRRVLERKLRNGSASEVRGKHEDSCDPQSPGKVVGSGYFAFVILVLRWRSQEAYCGLLASQPKILSPSERLFLKSR